MKSAQILPQNVKGYFKKKIIYMKGQFGLFFLALGFTTLSSIAQTISLTQYNLSEWETIEIEPKQTGETIDRNIFVLGEYVMLKDNKQIGLQIFKYLYLKNNVKLWIIDESPVYEYFLNRYLETKDEEYKNHLLRLKTVGLRKAESEFIDSLCSFIQINKVKDLNIQSFNLSIENEDNMYKAIFDLLEVKGKAPQNIKSTIDDLREISNNKLIAPNSLKVNRVFDELFEGITKQNEYYKSYLGKDFQLFIRILKIKLICMNYGLNNYSFENLSNRFVFCASDIENTLKSNTNSNIFIQQELPWVFNFTTKNGETIELNYLKKQLSNIDNFQITTIARLRSDLESSKCKFCDLGLIDSDLIKIKKESKFPISLFEIRTLKNDIDYVVYKK